MCFLASLLLGWPMQAAQAQNNWDRYKPGSLADVIRDNDSTIRSTLLDKKPAGISPAISSQGSRV